MCASGGSEGQKEGEGSTEMENWRNGVGTRQEVSPSSIKKRISALKTLQIHHRPFFLWTRDLNINNVIMHSFIHSYAGWLLFLEVVGSDAFEEPGDGPLVFFPKASLYWSRTHLIFYKSNNGGKEQEKRKKNYLRHFKSHGGLSQPKI